MMFEIRVLLTPGSYNIAHERLFYFCIKKKKKKSFKVCMFSDRFQAMSLFWYTYLF